MEDLQRKINKKHPKFRINSSLKDNLNMNIFQIGETCKKIMTQKKKTNLVL
jgi:hypothetical protein